MTRTQTVDVVPDLKLPEYQRPPVAEVVCGLQFEPLPLLTPHLGDFWQRVRGQYPIFEDAPPLSDVFEETSGRTETTPGPGQVMETLPLRRVYFLEPGKNFLLQVTPTRFLANWRKLQDGDEYPRFESAYRRLGAGWKSFSSYLEEMGLPAPRLNQYEVTYINHMFEGERPLPLAIEDYVPLLRWPSGAIEPALLGLPRAAMVKVKYPMPDDRGALHLTINHGERNSDKKRVMILELTARGPASPDGSDRERWFQIAHETIVNSFTGLTSGSAHKQWGRSR